VLDLYDTGDDDQEIWHVAIAILTATHVYTNYNSCKYIID